MPFVRPTLKQLYERVSRDFSGQLLDGSPLLARSVLAVLARVWAGACHMMYTYLGWVFVQVFVDTAEGAFLRRWARVWGIYPVPAASAGGGVRFAGAGVIPSGTLLTSPLGFLYTTVGDTALSAGAGVARIAAVEPGLAGNLPAGAELALVSPIPGVDGAVVVDDSGITGGADDEGDDSLRTRLLARLRQPPRGGNPADYETWVREVDATARVFVDPCNQGPGTVGVCYLTGTGPTAPFPSAEQVARAQTHVSTWAPVPAEVFLFAARRQDVTLRVTIEPDTVETRAAVRAALAALFVREATPGGTMLLSHIRQSISLAPGVHDYVVHDPAGNIIMPVFTHPILAGVDFEAAP